MRKQRTHDLIRAASDEQQNILLSESTAVDLLAAEGDEKKVRKFRMKAYSGGRMFPAGFPNGVVVDLAGMKVSAKSRPILRSHDSDRIIGHTDRVSINAGSISVEGTISAVNEYAREVVESSDNGFPWQASIGARVIKLVFVDRGETTTVNGRKVKGPVYIARQTVLNEISFVPLGADDNTSAVVAAGTMEDFIMGFSEWLKAQGFKEEDLTAAQIESMKAVHAKLLEAAEPDSDEDDEGAGQKVKAKAKAKSGSLPNSNPEDFQTLLQAAGGDGASEAIDQIVSQAGDRLNKLYAQQAEYVAGIDNLIAEYKTATVEVNGKKVDLKSHALKNKWDLNQVENALLKADSPKAPSVHSHDSESDGQAIEAALLNAHGVDEKFLGEEYDEKVMNAALSRRYQNYSLHAVMGDVIRAAGHHYSGSFKSNDFIKAAYTAERTQLAANSFTTLSLTNILENVANKALIAAYRATNSTWSRICRVSNLSDFKVHSRYRLDSTGAFKKVAADGELQHAGLSNAKYTNQLDTYGAILALTRQDQINDDLDAFLQLPTMLGRMAVVRLEEAVYVLLLSNPSSFFSSDNANYFDGASSALGISSLSTAKQKFLDMVDSNGKPVLATPKTLVVPTTLWDTAEDLISERMIVDGTTTNRRPNRNPHANTLSDPVATPYLNNTNITDQDGNAISGQSDTQWYLFADPADRAAINVGFLNGQRMPTIESAEMDFSKLGMQWRSYHDFGVGMEDAVAAVKSKGAA